MKKFIIALAIVLSVGLTANAQRDGFFNDWDDYSNGLDRDDITMPTLPGHGLSGNQDAPLGSGLLILTAMGAGYAIARRKREE